MLCRLVLILFALVSVEANAQVGLIGGWLVAGKAGDELRSSIDRARESASALLERANELGKQRIDQINDVVNRTGSSLIGQSEAAASKIILDAKNNIDKIRENIIDDLKRIIWEAECAGRRTTIGDLNEVLGGLGKVLSLHQIRISPPIEIEDQSPWWCNRFLCNDPYVIDIKEPFGDTYIDVRNIMESSISSDNIIEETPAHRIVGAYEYISAFALKTACFYPGSGDVWNREYVKYREMAASWRRAANIAVK